MEDEFKLLNDLLNIGCCKLCAVRYLCKKQIDFSNVDEYLLEHRFHENVVKTDNEATHNTVIKKIKTNPCVVCLGLLQKESLTQIIQSSKLDKARQYDSEVFTCSISMPAAILLREHSMQIYLKNQFPSLYKENTEIPLNRVWKVFVKNELGRCLQKEFENSDTCNFSINVAMSYPLDTEELDNLRKMQPKMYEERATQRRKYNCELFSRKGVITALSNTTSGTFMENYPVPPEIPSKFLQVKDIECKHNSIFCCISENNLKFSSSGREDCDVRCLGKGRPFYIEVLDPMKTKISFKEFRQIETEINKTELIGVLHMQNVDRSELTKVKEGEEEKTKDYNALCLTKDPITQEQLDKINNYGKVEILQKTPIRVLHRRPLAIRNKTIYEMKAKPVEGKPNLIDLHLNTQAGTYVKEFVHGDFGRTIPNIGEIIGTDVDIIALDVTAINLDWPTEIEYESNNDIKSSDNNVNDIPNKS
ncbi:hypothetical protein MML48_5g00009058 [Holotrichia oblita]|uniref:Uncharacterized protein n=1 Tax=Holotrichia oblita TaxID=644536 RepID=A0ACB9T4U8_HOLOL|nr:hypothetical protein MML48_5g00009058 [Holotrichia oblita]